MWTKSCELGLSFEFVFDFSFYMIYRIIMMMIADIMWPHCHHCGTDGPGFLNESQIEACTHTHTHSHTYTSCCETASVSWYHSNNQTTRSCLEVIHTLNCHSMWSVSSLSPIISTLFRLLIGLFPLLRGAGRLQPPACDFSHRLFAQKTNKKTETAQKSNVTVKAPCQPHKTELSVAQMKGGSWTWRLWTTMRIPLYY